MSRFARVCALVVAAVISLQVAPVQAVTGPTFAQAGEQATATLLQGYYAGGGLWRECNQPACPQANSDWGVDSATYALYLRWKATGDPHIRGVAAALLAAGPHYPADPCNAAPCPAWSDTPAWDAVAFMREGQITGNRGAALGPAKAAFRYLARSRTFAGGACPAIPYQHPQPSVSPVKTLETDANATKAALLIYDVNHDAQYLDEALSRYAADRRYFLDPAIALYTVHVIDDGTTCEQQSHRFFASVNGDMIWNGLELWSITGREQFYAEAVATARAVDTTLSDDRGIFVDLAGANDVVEPLIEAMFELAANERLDFARDWILRNAAAALSARAPDGTFSRFFDGPPQATASIWESNGGLALEIAAAALDPDGLALDADAWQNGRFPGARLTELPATITFEGSGIALLGTIGPSYETAHLRIFIDGVQPLDRTGLWQNHGMPVGSDVRFAWRWPVSGRHTLRLELGKPTDRGSEAVHLESIILTAGNV